MHLTRNLVHLFLGAIGSASVFAQSGEALPGEVIVKFRADSQAGRLVTQAFREQDYDARRLESAAGDLAADCGLPLRAKRLTSGAELLVELDAVSLLERLRISVSMRPDVESVSLQRLTAISPLKPSVALVVRFTADSGSMALLERARSSEPAALAKLVSGLTGDAEIPVLGEPAADHSLSLIPNIEILIGQLLSCLERHPDVEYSQPNRMMRIPGGLQ